MGIVDAFQTKARNCTLIIREEKLHLRGLTCCAESGVRKYACCSHSTCKFCNKRISCLDVLSRPLVKSAYQKNNFLISKQKHMLWVLKEPSQ